jgi:hypothetical protein
VNESHCKRRRKNCCWRSCPLLRCGHLKKMIVPRPSRSTSCPRLLRDKKETTCTNGIGTSLNQQVETIELIVSVKAVQNGHYKGWCDKHSYHSKQSTGLVRHLRTTKSSSETVPAYYFSLGRCALLLYSFFFLSEN